MKKDIFIEQICKLMKIFYKEKEINEASIEAFWDELKDIPDDVFIKTCNNIITYESRFPEISVFMSRKKKFDGTPSI